MCCSQYGAEEALEIARRILAKHRSPSGPAVRINSAGCLGRCGEGPVVVSYPRAEWFRYDAPSDLERIVKATLFDSETASDLKI